MTDKHAQKIRSLQEKRAKLNAEIRRQAGRASAEKRKARNRALVNLGVMIEQSYLAGKTSDQIIQSMAEAWLDERGQAVVAEYMKRLRQKKAGPA